MTTNQTIDGVPRELLERLRDGNISIAGPDFWAAWKELRALLDAPAKSFAQVASESAYCQKTPSAQTQGDPVATVSIWHVDQWYANDPSKAGRNVGVKFIGDTSSLKDGQPLYAEQPAPVAVVLPDPVTPEEFGDESMANGWNDCLDEVTRLNAKE